MNNGKVSIVIPTYNRADMLERAIKSVLEQSYNNKEIIVVDDGSTDETAEVLNKYDDKIKHYSILHSGVSAARNFGIEKANGEYIAFLDSDDYWLDGKLQKQMKYMEEEDFKISQTDEKWLRDGNWVMPGDRHQKQSGDIFEKSVSMCIVSPSAVVIHRSILDEVGKFDESFPACEDYDLWLRISLNYKVGLLDEELVVKVGGHSDQLSNKYWGLDRFRVRALEKILDGEMNNQQRKLVLEEIVKKLEILDKGRKKREDLPNIYTSKLRKYEEKLEKFYESQKIKNK